jgi:hypothetical protein
MYPVHFSNLKQLAKSAAHYRHAITAGVDETRAMRIGSCTHAFVLGGRYHLYEGERRGKAWAQFKAEHDDGATIVTSSEHAEASAIADAVLANPDAARLLSGPYETEKSLQWSWLGRECEGRVDLIGPNFIADLKVTSSAELRKFEAHAIRMGWHAQLPWYQRGAGRDPVTSESYLIAVESSAPHCVVVRQLTERAADAGDRMCRLWMEQLLGCEAVNQWPGYAQSIVPLDLPEWADTEDLELTIDGEAVSM